MIGLLFLLAKIIIVPTDSATIQKGMNGCVSGDTLQISNGTYLEYNLSAKQGITTLIRGESNANNVIVDAQKLGSCVRMTATNPGSSDTLIFQDISFIKGYGVSGGGAYFYYQFGVTLRRCKFENDTAYPSGGGGIGGGQASGSGISCAVKTENCLFDGCYSASGGGAENMYYTAYIAINNTYVNCGHANVAGSSSILSTSGVYGYGLYKKINSIIWDCGPGDSLFYYGSLAQWDSVINCDLDTVGVNSNVKLKNCIITDPLFIGGGNYHLGTESPGIGIGFNVTSVLTTLLDLDKVAIANPFDLGCYKYTIPVTNQRKVIIGVLFNGR